MGIPRRWTYAALGFVLALGAPLGLVLLRILTERGPPLSVLVSELRDEPSLYAYMTLSTAAVFAMFGWAAGRLQDRLEETSMTDPLTGLANRRHLSLLLEHALARALRDTAPLSLLLVDVDDLKRINDAGGHAAGDRALLAVAGALRSASRRSDLAARVGGDEFALLATGSAPVEALRLGERIRAALASEPGAPRVSIGVATLGREETPDAASLLAAADKALYAAKAAGRDRVVAAPPPPD